jgi:hypothetical protein
MEAQDAATPDMEFHADQYNDSFLPTLRTATMKSVDTQNEGNMGDLLQKLDSLDDFFDETDIGPAPLNSISGTTLRNFTGDFHDASHLYDQQTAPLLRKSLARTASSSSFHNGLAESRPPTARAEPSGVHSSPLTSGSTNHQTLRTSMHTRSVTSPTNNFFTPIPGSQTAASGTAAIGFTSFSDDELEEALSDSDDRLDLNTPASASAISSRTGPEGPFSLESMIRSSVRRLTGGSSSSRDKERQRDLLRAQQRAFAQTAASPRVPKVPAEYLMSARSTPASPRP